MSQTSEAPPATPTNTTAINMEEYAAISNAVAVQNRPTAGVIEMTDADRSDFLQRMTTNNIVILTPGQSTVTVLTSPVARNIFVFTVLCFEEKLLLLPAVGESQALYKHLRSQIFFMDKVKIEDQSAAYARMRILGPKAESALAHLNIEPSSLNAETFGAIQLDETTSATGIALNQQAFDMPGFELIVPIEQQETTLNKLTSAGIPAISDATYHTRRIELGRPQSGFELTDAYSPLESGLAWACSENKGCYTGQEIIARQITYDKITKSLVGLRLSEPADRGSEIYPEGKSKGRSIGEITSTAHSPALASPIAPPIAPPIALAIIKRPQNEIGTIVQIGSATAEVVALPFVS